MRMTTVAAGLMLALAGAGGRAEAPADALKGDYVEARTCSVYTGACHANGEMVTTGREAMLAWHITSGSLDGVKLDGLNAVAVMTGRDNLAAKGCSRDSVLFIDSRATEEQKEALVGALSWKFGCALGRITSVKTAPVEFKKDGLQYTVRIPNTAYLKTTRYACDHCVMPHLVWYDPFVHLKSSIIAKASANEFKGAADCATRWSRFDENSSYVGEF